MADEVERIRLEYDETGALKSADKVNEALAQNEAQAVKTQAQLESTAAAVTKSVDVETKRILTITDTRASAIQRIVRAAEQRAAFAAASPTEKIQLKTQQDLARVAGDEAAQIKVRAAGARELAAAQKAATQDALNTAITASRRAATESASFERALSRVNTEIAKQKQQKYDQSLSAAASASRRATAEANAFQAALIRVNAANRELIATSERQAQLAGLSGIQRLQTLRQQEISSLGPNANAAAVTALEGKYGALIAAQTRADNTALLNRATVASQRAAVETDNFARALTRLNAQQARQNELLAAQRAQIVADVTRRAATNAERLAIDRAAALSKLGPGASKAQIDAVTSAFDKLEAAQQKQSGFSGLISRFVNNPLKTTATEVEGLASKFGAFAIGAGAAIVGFGLVAKGAFDLVSGAAERARETINIAERLGTTNEQAYRLGAIAKVTGVEVSSLSAFMRRLSQALVDGSEEGKRGAKALQDIGVYALDANGKIKPTIQLINEISLALKAIPDTATQEARFAAFGGRGAIELLPFFLELQKVGDQLDKNGSKLDSNLIAKLSAANTQLKELAVRFDILKSKIAEKLIVAIDFIIREPANKPKLAGLGGRGKAARSALLEFLGIPGDTFNIEIAPPPRPATPGLAPAALQSIQTFQSSVKAGDALLAGYKSRLDTVTALQERIKDEQNKLGEVEAKLQPGIKADVQRQTIAEADSIRRRLEADQQRLKILNAIPGAEKQSHDFLLKSQKEYQDEVAKSRDVLRESSAASVTLWTAVAKVIDENRLKMAELRDEGTLTAKSLGDLNRALITGLRTAALQGAGAQLKEIQDEGKRSLAFDSARFEKQQQFSAETARLDHDSITSRFSFEETIAAQSRDRQIRAIENTDAKTLAQKVAFEIRKGEIEAQFTAVREKLQLDSIERQHRAAILGLTYELAAKQISLEAFYERYRVLNASSLEARRQAELTAVADIEKARQEASIKAAEAVRDANTKVFDAFKRESEGIFDAMLTKSQNIFQAIGNSLKNVFLTAVKDIVSTQSARLLTEFFTGQHVGLTPAVTAQGPLARIGALLGIGAKPTFGTGKLQDVQLQNGAVPVVITNPQPPPPAAVLATPTAEEIGSAVSSAQSPQLSNIAGNIADATSGGSAAEQIATAAASSATSTGRSFLAPIIGLIATPLAAVAAFFHHPKQLESGPGATLVPGAFGGGAQRAAATATIGALLTAAATFAQPANIATPPFIGNQIKISRSNQPGHVGDVITVSSPIGAAIPVVIANPADISVVQVKQQTTATSVGGSVLNVVAGGGGGGGGILAGLKTGTTALPAAIGLLLSLGTKGAGGAGGGGSIPAGIVSSSIDFGGGAQSLGSTIFGGGGGLAGLQIPGLTVNAGGFETGAGGLAGGLGGNVSDVGFARLAQILGLAGGGGGAEIPAGTGTSGFGGLLGLSRFANLGGTLSSLKTFLGLGTRAIVTGPGTATTIAGISQSLGGGALGAIGGTAAGLLTSPAAGLAGSLVALQGLSELRQNPQSVGGAVKLTGGAALTGVALGSALGVGASGGGVLGAGIGLTAAGLARGGKIGILETSAGGALIGFSFGGPLGAAIGAGVGFTVGLIRSFFKTKAEKTRDEIKRIYGIDVKDRGILNQIVGIINQNFGGNINAGILSQPVREILQLYAQSTGQNALGIVATPQAAIFATQGGKVTELPTFFNGQPVFPGQTQARSGLPILTSQGYITQPVPSGANVIQHTTLSLDAAATTALLQGQTVQTIQAQPRLISSASSSGQQLSSTQRSNGIRTLNPTLIAS